MSEPVGYLVLPDNIFVCPECLDTGPDAPSEPVPIPIYHENIHPHRQGCHLCDRVLVHPRTEAWPELFEIPLGMKLFRRSRAEEG